MSTAIDKYHEAFKAWFHERYGDTDAPDPGPSEESLSFLAALDKAGLKVLGREPTEEMVRAWFDNEDALHTWRAMWDAAPPAPEPRK